MRDLYCGRLLCALIVICSVLSCTALTETQGRQPMASTREVQPTARGQRLRPPDSLQCPRNHLTAFNGTVQSFHRERDQAVIRLHTDEDTTEQFTLRHPTDHDPTAWFLLKGAPFQAADWALIESAPNRLWPGMHAIVWVCDDGTNPVIDWRPSEPNQPPIAR
jgi:hypothetical protein